MQKYKLSNFIKRKLHLNKNSNFNVTNFSLCICLCIVVCGREPFLLEELKVPEAPSKDVRVVGGMMKNMYTLPQPVPTHRSFSKHNTLVILFVLK